ncbi:unnamed protein product [Tilletia controversa]|uniref:hydroxymethylbilane synthase n=1 Tax=Tilletia caries TaxID=13290 RepID=A0ABN7IX22_9BASI|nr:unnamed protein product [Tilletia controversa]CAD6927788.1 unnamed protein product [Tilletia caries]
MSAAPAPAPAPESATSSGSAADLPQQKQQRPPPHLDPQEAVCPVTHVPNQPLPPGHPPVHGIPSNLKLPGGARCVFYRSLEDYNTSTPPLSRSPSLAAFYSTSTAPPTPTPTPTPGGEVQQRKNADANINPLPDGGGLTLDPTHSLVLASRNSQLALVQSSHVSTMLDAHYGSHSPAFLTRSDMAAHLTPALLPSKADGARIRERIDLMGLLKPCYFPITSMSTAGDQNQRSPLYVIGGEGRAIWTKELEVALQEGAIDAIVHCLKDIPTVLPDGLELAAICEREDPRDALVVKKGLPFTTLDELPPGSVIGTSSVRRVAQLRRRYPQLVFSDVRGNINTRLTKLDSPSGPYTALVLAAAGLIRLNLSHRITAFLTSPVLYYSVGQGALAIEVRSPPPGATPRENRDARIKMMIGSIGCWRATWRGEAERALLRELEGGCSIPVGVESRFEDHGGWEAGRKELEGVPTVLVDGETGEERLVEGHFAPVRHAYDGFGPNGGANGNGETEKDAVRPLLSSMPSMSIPTTETEVEHQARLDSLDAAIAAAANPTEDESPPYVCPVAAEDLCTPPASPAVLHLHATVVSLDGARSCSSSLSSPCKNVEEARALGVRVARALIEGGGASEILEEVERHRRWAEMADQARRKARLEGKSESEAMAIAAAGMSSARRAASSTIAEEEKEEEGATVVPGLGPYATEEIEKRRKLEETLSRAPRRASSSAGANGRPKVEGLSQVPGSGTAGVQVEVDRRFVPRDDGQAKAWEV